jgi:F-type H+-transporting ATPase subunit delta
VATADLAAKRYALAAFAIAKERGTASEWTAALAEMAAFMSRPDVRLVLDNTRVPREEKQRLAEAGLRQLPPLPLNLARLLVSKGRTPLVNEIAAGFRELVEADQGVVHATATTAVPLAGPERERLVRRLEQQTGRSVVLDAAVDPALVGGVVIQIGDRLVDASTRARLEALRESLVG